MPITAKKIKELVKEYGLGELYAVIEDGVHGSYKEENKDKLAASIYCKNTSVNIYKDDIQENLVNPLKEDLEHAVRNCSHDGAGAGFTFVRGRIGSVGFMAQGWPKMKQILNALGIKYEFHGDFVKDKNRLAKGKDTECLTPKGIKFLESDIK